MATTWNVTFKGMGLKCNDKTVKCNSVAYCVDGTTRMDNAGYGD